MPLRAHALPTGHAHGPACRSGLVPLEGGQVTTLKGLVQHISADEDLAELSASAAAAQQTVEALAARQAAALEVVSQELLASPEILRWASLCVAGCWHATGVRVDEQHQKAEQQVALRLRGIKVLGPSQGAAGLSSMLLLLLMRLHLIALPGGVYSIKQLTLPAVADLLIASHSVLA